MGILFLAIGLACLALVPLGLLAAWLDARLDPDNEARRRRSSKVPMLRFPATTRRWPR